MGQYSPLAGKQIGISHFGTLSPLMGAVAVKNQTTARISSRLGFIHQYLTRLSGNQRTVISSRAFLCNHKHFQPFIVKIKIANVSSIAMSKSCTPKRRAIVVNHGSPYQYLIVAVAIEVTHRNAVRSFTIDSATRIVGGVFPDAGEVLAIPRVGCRIRIGIDATHRHCAWGRFAIHIEKCHTAFQPVAPVAIGIAICAIAAVVPVFLYAEEANSQ